MTLLLYTQDDAGSCSVTISWPIPCFEGLGVAPIEQYIRHLYLEESAGGGTSSQVSRSKMFEVCSKTSKAHFVGKRFEYHEFQLRETDSMASIHSLTQSLLMNTAAGRRCLCVEYAFLCCSMLATR